MGWDSHADFDGTRKANFASKESIGPELGHEEILYNPWPREALMLYLSAHAVSTFKILIQPTPFLILIDHSNFQTSNSNKIVFHSPFQREKQVVVTLQFVLRASPSSAIQNNISETT